MMNRCLTALSWIAFGLTAVVGALSSWLYAAWEMWYFWPFAGLIFLAALAQGARISIQTVVQSQAPYGATEHHIPRIKVKRVGILLASCAPFLIYATVRFLQAPVVMEAQRSYLLHATSVLLALAVIFGFSRLQIRLLLAVVGVSMFLQIIAGPVWLYLLNDEYVFLRPNAFGYHGRAKSSFFCPDHYAGLMELTLCLALGVCLSLKEGWIRRILLLLAAAGATFGVLISKSRGGGLTLAAITFAVIVVGFFAWSPKKRWMLRGITVAGCIAILLLGLLAAPKYVARFKEWHAWNPERRDADLSLSEDMYKRFLLTSRGQMISSALRAWRSAPIFGIGPGMHQNVWFQFATSDDGDRTDPSKKPTYNYTASHSYEVHSDWVQLLEEYGMVGLVLMLLAFGVIIAFLWRRLIRLSPPASPNSVLERAAPLTALLSLAALGFHSLGDFNLQMPSNAWTMAILVSAGLATALTERHHPQPDCDDK